MTLYNCPVVSVIIPAYNYARYIRGSIDSVLCQDISNIQILVVDDGSTDNTREIADEYGDKIEYHYQENSGLSAARNTGMKFARGKYIQFLDADDFLGDGSIKSRMRYLDRHPGCDIAVNRNYYFSRIKNNKPVRVRSSGWPLYTEKLHVHLCFLNIAPPHAYLIRRSVIEKVGEFDSEMKVCEDYDYWVRAMQAGFNIEYCRQGSVYYRRHDSNMSHDKTRQYIYDCKVHAKIVSFLERQPSENSCLEELIASLAGTIFLVARLQEADLDVGCDLGAQYHTILNLLEENIRYGPATWSPLSQLYFLRCLYEIDKIAGHGAAIIHNVERIYAVFNSLGGYDSRWIRTLKYLVKGQGLGWLGRYRLLKYSVGV